MVVYKLYRPLGAQHHYTYPLTMQVHSLVDRVLISILALLISILIRGFSLWYNDIAVFDVSRTRTTPRLRDRPEPTCTTNANPGPLRLTATDTNDRHVSPDPD